MDRQWLKIFFEALAICLSKEMTITGIAKTMSYGQAALWRMLTHHVNETVAQEDYSGLKALGVDECSKRRGHQYITTFCDLDASRVVHVEEGRKNTVFAGFACFLEDHHVPDSQVTEICMDRHAGGLHEGRAGSAPPSGNHL